MNNICVVVNEMIPLWLRKLLGNGWVYCARAARYQWQLWKLRGMGVECNLCGWQGRAFADGLWHKQSLCPRCKSDIRHRLLMACWLLQIPNGWGWVATIAHRRILHFAPERILRPFIAQKAAQYWSADFDRGDVDWKLDISHMPAIANQSIDTVIALDVLEHVPQDKAAMQEMYRILTDQGLAILSVPQMDSPAETEEELAVLSHEERLRRFGQHDHVRIYGDDFLVRLQSVGFMVTSISAKDFSLEVQKRYGLVPSALNPNRLATNNRRIYFARKAVVRTMC